MTTDELIMLIKSGQRSALDVAENVATLSSMTRDLVGDATLGAIFRAFAQHHAALDEALTDTALTLQAEDS